MRRGEKGGEEGKGEREEEGRDTEEHGERRGEGMEGKGGDLS